MTPRDYGIRCGRIARTLVHAWILTAFGLGFIAWAYAEPLT